MIAGESRSFDVHLAPGEEYVLELAGLAAVGYMWMTSVQGDPTAVAVSQETVAAAERLLPGQSAHQRFTMRAVHQGEASVLLELRRPPVPDEPPFNAVTIRVFVGSPGQGSTDAAG